MPSFQPEVSRQDQLLAMRDASAGAFEAARVKYFRLLRHMEVVSIEYVVGKCDKAQVNAVAEQLLMVEFNVSEAARQTRLYQEALDKLIIGGALNRNTPPVAPRKEAHKRNRPIVRKNRYLELVTLPGR